MGEEHLVILHRFPSRLTRAASTHRRMRRALCVVLWQSLLVVQFTAALYVDRSTTLVHRPRRCSGGTAVVDTDGDGRFELLVVGCAGSPNQLLQYDDQNKSFADLAPGSHLADLE